MNRYGRMYRTGDVVRMLPGGEVGFVGRRDGQVVNALGIPVTIPDAKTKATLRNNRLESVPAEVEWRDPGEVLLCGATGYLGIHVLKDLLDNARGTVTCLVRGKTVADAEDRLRSLLVYYFEDDFSGLFGNRLKVVTGDVTDDALKDGACLDGVRVDTIYNCAAMVKHFCRDSSIYKVNLDGVRNLIALAEKTGARLVQVSTASVAGESVDGSVPDGFLMAESALYFGQALDNKYIHSKYEAEVAVAQAVARGLKAKVIRVGNLMSRHSDGEFQINFQSNNFMNTIRSLRLFRCVPYDMLRRPVEFSPIDCVASAIVLLSGTDDRFTCFHAVNCNIIRMNNVVDDMNQAGKTIRKVPAKEFMAALDEAIRNEATAEKVNALTAYRSNRAENRHAIHSDGTFTEAMLYRMGFAWPVPGSDYMFKLISALEGLNFFD